jgi:hypothetical protein
MYEFIEKFENDIPEIKSMTILRLEYCKHQENKGMSEIVEYFLFDMHEHNPEAESYTKLLSVFGRKPTPEKMAMLKDKCECQEDIIGFIVNYMGKDGILAEISMRDHTDWKFKEDGSFKSCRGACSSTLKWIYADTVEDLLKVMMEEGKKHWEDSMNKAKEKASS